MGLENTRLLIVVKNADYREALSHIFMPERLGEQLSGRVSPVDIHILKAAVLWSSQVQEVAIFSCYSDEKYSDMTYLNFRIMGSGVSSKAADAAPFGSRLAAALNRDLIRLVADFCPNRLVVGFQSLTVLKWATRNKISTLALLPDWPESNSLAEAQTVSGQPGRLGFWQRWQRRQLIRQLNRPSVHWVGGQGVQTSERLADAGIDVGKIIPWEWAQPQLLHQSQPKQMREHGRKIELVYVGELDEKAGMDDLLKAVTQLRRNRYTVSLQLIRNTLNYTSPVEPRETAWLEIQVQRLALADSVSVWAGLSPEHMLERVQAADLLVMPRPPKQRSTVPPLGIALSMAACTPIIACDHPYLDDHVLHGVNMMSFPVGNPKSMAHRIERTMTHSDSYAQLSAASHMALSKIKVPARWAELIEKWMGGKVYDQQWIRDFALSSGRYTPLDVKRSKLRFVEPEDENEPSEEDLAEDKRLLDGQNLYDQYDQSSYDQNSHGQSLNAQNPDDQLDEENR
ncbi:MAG: glycosyltransferase [Cyanobacteria bacterium J06650_10]